MSKPRQSPKIITPGTSGSTRGGWWRQPHIIVALGLALGAALVYLPILDNEFVNFDDVFYILNSPQISQLDAASFKTWFSGFYFGNYQPLTLLSLALDYQWRGPDPYPFHLGNLLLHALNTVLVFWFGLNLVRRRYRIVGLDGGWQPLVVAAVAGALFAVHPQHVESVAWASQRKDLLYAAFYLAAMIAYLNFTTERKLRFYVASLVLFGCSVLSKAMAVSLFASLLAIDFYLKRLDWRQTPAGMGIGTHLKEKGPFFCIALVMGVLAAFAQKSSSFMAQASLHKPWQQGLYACYGLTQYLVKLLVPNDLSAYYPYPDPGDLPLSVWLSPLVVLGVIFWLVKNLRHKETAAFGLLFFLVNIAPVLQLVPIGNFVLADRFVYLPSLGIFVMLGAAVVALVEQKPTLKKVVLIVCSAYVVLLGSLTLQRANIWQDSLTLWNDVLAKYPDISLALNNRGIARGQAGDLTGAIADFDRSVAITPDYADAYCNRGLARLSMRDYTAAIGDFELSLANNPGDSKARVQQVHAHFFRGVQRAQAGDNQGAEEDFGFVVKADPGYPNAAKNLAVVRQRLGR